MKVHYLQHVPFEGLGSIHSWLERGDHEITGTRLYESAAFPDLSEFDLLIIMGGPMSVDDNNGYDWLPAEKRFIQDALDAKKSVLGICLGAQLIADALGARVVRNEYKEIGWFPIRGVQPRVEYTLNLPPELEVFHWHSDTFELPEYAVRLAESEGCANQAFQVGRNIVGLQFHLETTPASARQIVANCRDDLLPSRYVQSEAEILDATATQYEAINSVMCDVLDYFSQQKKIA